MALVVPIYEAVPCKDVSGHTKFSDNVNTVQSVSLSTLPRPMPTLQPCVTAAAGSRKQVSFSDKVQVSTAAPFIHIAETGERQMPQLAQMRNAGQFDNNFSKVFVQEERQMPPDGNDNFPKFVSLVNIDNTRKLAQCHNSAYVNAPGLPISNRELHNEACNFNFPEYEERQIPQSCALPKVLYEGHKFVFSSNSTFDGASNFEPSTAGTAFKRSSRTPLLVSRPKAPRFENFSVTFDNDGTGISDSSEPFDDYGSFNIDTGNVDEHYEEGYDPDFEFSDFTINLPAVSDQVDNVDMVDLNVDFVDLQYGGSDKKSPPVVEALASQLNLICTKKTFG